MPSLLLEKAERKALVAQAHPLNPVVLLGATGLTPAVLQEILIGANLTSNKE